jgi:hypothetical protein
MASVFPKGSELGSNNSHKPVTITRGRDRENQQKGTRALFKKAELCSVARASSLARWLLVALYEVSLN